MELIYKIVGNFDDCDFEAIINKVNQIFKFIYINDTLYLSLINYQDYDKQKEVLEQAFQPANNFLITPINEKNIMKQNDVAIQWCRDNFVNLETQRYEIEQQQKLLNVWERMNKLEEILQQELQIKNANKSNLLIENP